MHRIILHKHTPLVICNAWLFIFLFFFFSLSLLIVMKFCSVSRVQSDWEGGVSGVGSCIAMHIHLRPIGRKTERSHFLTNFYLKCISCFRYVPKFPVNMPYGWFSERERALNTLIPKMEMHRKTKRNEIVVRYTQVLKSRLHVHFCASSLCVCFVHTLPSTQPFSSCFFSCVVFFSTWFCVPDMVCRTRYYSPPCPARVRVCVCMERPKAERESLGWFPLFAHICRWNVIELFARTVHKRSHKLINILDVLCIWLWELSVCVCVPKPRQH